MADNKTLKSLNLSSIITDFESRAIIITALEAIAAKKNDAYKAAYRKAAKECFLLDLVHQRLRPKAPDEAV